MFKTAVAAITGAAVLWVAGPAQARDVYVMGSVRANFENDRDEVENPKSGKRLAGLELAARRGSLSLQTVTVRFGNGSTKTYKINRRISSNSRPVYVDFEARRGRFVDEVTVVHRTRNARGDRQAELVIAGDVAVARPAPIARPDRRNWDELGILQVRTRTDDRDIAVSRDVRRTNVIGFAAANRPVFLSSVTVRYRDGSRNRFRPETLIRPGDPVYKVKLGERRQLRSVSVVYRGRRQDRDLGRGQLAVLSGKIVDRDRPRNRPNEWVLIGTGKAAVFSKDYDALQIGKDVGRFRAVRITARRQDVRMYGMRITYGNGTKEDVPVFGWVRKNQRSQPFDLKGRKRAIKSIEFRYRSKLSLKGSGRIEVEGLR